MGERESVLESKVDAMSLDGSDDDIPGLESVSGSDYLSSEEDSENEMPPPVEGSVPTDSPHYINAKQWVELGAIISEHVDVVRVYILSPFLYGHAHQSDRWLKWCQQVGLLGSDIEFNLETLSEKELLAVDVLLKAMKYIKPALEYISGEQKQVSELAQLLRLGEEVEVFESVSKAVHAARKRGWFMILINEFQKSADKVGGVPSDVLNDKSNFIDIGCLYVIYQAYDHVMKMLTGKADYFQDFNRQLQSNEESGVLFKDEGEEYSRNGDYDQAIETYTTAIICCPYYHQLYINRAYVYMKIQNYRASISDGLRAVQLRPDNSKSYICYIQALKLGGEKERCDWTIEEFNRKFPKEKNNLKISLEQSYDMDKKLCKPTEKEIISNEKLQSTCKQASEAYLAGNLDQAVYYYQEAVTSSEEDGWQICWVFSECKVFLVSLHFAYGMALMKTRKMENAEIALTQFNIILDKHFSVFPPAYYGIGKSLAILHRHSEARDSIKKGLDQVPSYRATALTWPGTTTSIAECYPHDVESKLQQLLQLCEPKHLADAICRYANCLQHHTSTDIIFANTEYKGHIQVQCSEGCSIAYHSVCWRKIKSDSLLGSDREFLSTSCPTPDCGGTIKLVSVCDKGKTKIRLEADPKKATSNLPPTSLKLSSSSSLSKESKRANQIKNSKKKTGGDTPDGGSILSPPGDQPEEKTESEVESRNMAEFEDLHEDLRKGSAVVNRQEDQLQEGALGKSKAKKKTHKEKEKNKVVSDHWKDLFTLPEREGIVTGFAIEEDEDSVSKWEPDPNAPFQPPNHLKDIIDDFERNEVPSIGLAPRPTITGTGQTPANNSAHSSPPKENPPKPPTADECDELEFIISYFGEIVRTHGPLEPSDPKIVEPLSYLPEDKKQMIFKAGGFTKLLLSSGLFVMENGRICPAEDAAASSVKDSGKGVDKSGGSSSKGSKDSKNKNTGETKKHGVSSDGGNGTSTPPITHKQKPSLSDLMTASRSSTDSTSKKKSSKTHSRNNKLINRTLKKLSEELNNDRGWNVKVVSRGKNSITSPDISGLEKRSDLPAAKKGTVSQSGEASVSKELDVSGNRTKSSNAHENLGADLSKKSQTRSEKPMLSPPPYVASTGSKDSHNSSSSEGDGVEGSIESSSADLEKREDTFSPTNSTSSISSGSSSGAMFVPQPSTQKKSKKNSKKQKIAKDSTEISTAQSISYRPVECYSAMVQTDAPLLRDKWVMTDLVPPVESFKERYESALKEKKDLQVKLERSEDERFKMQKTHKREMEQQLKQTKQEAKEEVQGKLKEMDEKLKSEGARVDTVKKENMDQLRSSKAEIKSLTEKIERMKKDESKKEQQNESRIRQLRGEIDQLLKEKRKFSERLKISKDVETKAIIRATNSEVEVLSMRRDMIVKPCEMKLREVSAMCMSLPQGSEIHQECVAYREKMKHALDGYQVAVEDQICLVKSGRDLSSLSPVPHPVVPVPPQLGMAMMRPGFFPPMMPVPGRAPFPMGPGGMMDPSMMMRPRVPPPGPQGAPMNMSQPEPAMNHLHSPGEGDSESISQAATASPSEVDLMNGGSSGKKSSFDRIVEKLAPIYPYYARDDFKGVLREVRRNNKNTLSGLSLDSIAQQVKEIIDQREKKSAGNGGGGSARGSGGTSSGKAKSNSKGRHPDKKGKKPRLPPVAVAPPPFSSPMDYDDDSSCIICYEDMGEKNSSRLDCGHRFHSECIRSWFKEQSTCPTCRNHTLLKDEYPSLKH